MAGSGRRLQNSNTLVPKIGSGDFGPFPSSSSAEMEMSGSVRGPRSITSWLLRSLTFKHLLYDLFAWCGSHARRTLIVLGIHVRTGGY